MSGFFEGKFISQTGPNPGGPFLLCPGRVRSQTTRLFSAAIQLSATVLKLAEFKDVFAGMSNDPEVLTSEKPVYGGPSFGQDIWEPLPDHQWNEETARHLLERAGWTAVNSDLDRAVKEGLSRTFDRLFPATATAFEKPRRIEAIRVGELELEDRIKTGEPLKKEQLRKEFRERFQQGYQDLAIKWLEFASQPAVSAQEKWVLCLSDVYVVAYEKVKNPWMLYQHHQTLRSHAFGSAPALTKAVSRSPAMIEYLDLNQSKKDAPNENFARELFELFLLGEGHYTEADIKGSARAFTGYRQRLGEFVFARGQHDESEKTVFGHTGDFNGDQVIDLAYETPAARTFLCGELLRFYLSDDPIDPAALKSLGDWWYRTRFDLRALLRRVFTSQFFYDPSFRGNYIKSPIQFYLGLTQDLNLDVAPLPRQLVGALRQMGQMPFNPPNVRGWVGGRSWINSSTLGARRQLVQALFSAIQPTQLNADELVEIAGAEAEGHDHFTVDGSELKPFAALPPEKAARRLVHAFLPMSPDSEYEKSIARYLATGKPGPVDPGHLRGALLSLLQSPEYQLC